MKERKFIWSWKDPEHFEAHKKDFSRPMEEILEELESVLPATGERKAGTWYHEDFELSRSIGLSGLKVLFKREDPDEDTVFWAYRKGRSIPSQLALGKKVPTNSICLWGTWTDGGFEIHTVYPGRKAPREIHDPDLKLCEIAEAVEFWKHHAIITEKGEYSFEPND